MGNSKKYELKPRVKMSFKQTIMVASSVMILNMAEADIPTEDN